MLSSKPPLFSLFFFPALGTKTQNASQFSSRLPRGINMPSILSRGGFIHPAFPSFIHFLQILPTHALARAFRDNEKTAHKILIFLGEPVGVRTPALIRYQEYYSTLQQLQQATCVSVKNLGELRTPCCHFLKYKKLQLGICAQLGLPLKTLHNSLQGPMLNVDITIKRR